MSEENLDILKKFDKFLRSNRKLNSKSTDKLAQTMKKYVQTELSPKDMHYDNKSTERSLNSKK